MKAFWNFFRNKNAELSKLVLNNRTDHDMKICLEPWAHQYRLKSGQKAEIVGEGEISRGEIEIDYSENDIVIHGWLESMTLLIDGKEAEMDFSDL